MHQSPTQSAVARGAEASLCTDLIPPTILRTETVLSRLPIHTLTKKGTVSIHITRTNAHGDVDLRWDVSYNARYGPPRQLAYKLDTLVINRCLDALARPLPQVIRVGSLAQICARLGLAAGGRPKGHVKHALLQNALTAIVAQLRYKGLDGTEYTLAAGFTRYSVVFAGMQLPNGTTADAVYLLLNEPYWQVLNHAPLRPLDYAYLRGLAPTAQRCYELISYKIFAALAHGRPQATYPYAEYCTFAPQQRYDDFDHVKKQMYKVHRPHLASGYLARVHFEATLDTAGVPDWVMVYTPGPKARAEYTVCRRRPGNSRVASAAPGPDPDAPAPPARGVERLAEAAVAPAVPLVQHFYQRFHGVTVDAPPAKALYQAAALIAQHGAAAARFVVDFAWQQAQTTRYPVEHFGAILPYVPRALAVYEAQQQHATQQRAATRDAQWRVQYETFWQQEVRRLRATLAPDDLAALEATVRAQLVAAGETPACALDTMVRVERDAILAARAGIPTFDAWQQQHQEAAR
jgi:hypothetical protein